MRRVASDDAVVVPDEPEEDAESVAPVPVPDELLMPLPVEPLLEPIVDDPVPEVLEPLMLELPLGEEVLLPVAERLVDEPVPEVAEPDEGLLSGFMLDEPDPAPVVPEPVLGLVCACGAAHHNAAITALTAKSFELFFIGISITPSDEKGQSGVFFPLNPMVREAPADTQCISARKKPTLRLVKQERESAHEACRRQVGVTKGSAGRDISGISRTDGAARSFPPDRAPWI